MLHLIIVWFASALALLVTSSVVPGFEVKNFGSALLTSVVIGVLNMVIRPLIVLLTLPANIVTLGLFTFVINAMILKMASGLLQGFEVTTWWAAIMGAIVLAIIQVLLNFLVPDYHARGL